MASFSLVVIYTTQLQSQALSTTSGKGETCQLDGAVEGSLLLESPHAQGALVAGVKLLERFAEERLGAFYCGDIPGGRGGAEKREREGRRERGKREDQRERARGEGGKGKGKE